MRPPPIAVCRLRNTNRNIARGECEQCGFHPDFGGAGWLDHLDRREPFVVELQADSGTVTLTVYKGGLVIGGSAGGGTLNLRGRNYPLSVGRHQLGLVLRSERPCAAG